LQLGQAVEGRDMLAQPSGLTETEGMRMAFVFRLETADGAPAEPPTLNTATPSWSEGDCVPLGSGRCA
jgi:hypothetical protein